MNEAEQHEVATRNNEKKIENVKAGKSPFEGINFFMPTQERANLTVTVFETRENAQRGL